jgi:hypothetical protein
MKILGHDLELLYLLGKQILVFEAPMGVPPGWRILGGLQGVVWFFCNTHGGLLGQDLFFICHTWLIQSGDIV